jgi:hypothetical protein
VNLAEAAGAMRAVQARCEASLARDAAEAAAKDLVAILRIVTPKRSGALADSEIVNFVAGGGTHAVANYGPHKIYDKFRNDGGTISAHAGLGRKGMRPHTLHWAGGGFPLHVTQAGSHYMERGEAAGRSAAEQACRVVLDSFLTF